MTALTRAQPVPPCQVLSGGSPIQRTEHPAGQCPSMIAALDRLLSGVSIEELGREQGAVPT